MISQPVVEGRKTQIRSPVDSSSIGHRKRVMLAEDNPINRQIAIVKLEGFGCEVVCAVNGRQAIELARNCSSDLILMGCQMPEIDGFKATATIRACEAALAGIEAGASSTTRIPTRTPIIALTAEAALAAGSHPMQVAVYSQDNAKPSYPFAATSLHLRT